MRITFITLGFPPRPSGGVKVIYEYANGLVARGHDVTILHPPPYMPRITPYRVGRFLLTNLASPDRLLNGGRYLLTKLNSRKEKASLPQVVPAPKTEWFEIDSRVRTLLITYTSLREIPDGDAIAWYFGVDHAPRFGMPFQLIQGVIEGNGGVDTGDTVIRFPVPKVVISKWLYDQVLKLGIPPDDVIHIPNAIDHAKYRLLRPIDERPLRVAMMYSPGVVKGGEDGVKALELARKKFPALQAVLFGVFSKPRNLPPWIEYHRDPPQQTLVDSIYNGSAIHLCPSSCEGFYLPNAEAMACGCAVVSTDIGGVRDYAEHEVTALLSPPNDPKGLAQNVERLLRDETLRLKIAEAGRRRIQDFTWERNVTLFENFLTQKIQEWKWPTTSSPSALSDTSEETSL